jgi:hypothetical protein
MYEANKFGGGVAWRDLDVGNPIVRWKKGLDLEEMIVMNQTLPFPYILHFRVPSHDTSTNLMACHPFEVSGDARTEFEGTTNNPVLFHNGFWTDWRNKLQTLSLAGALKLPSGPWSDSRGLAWASGHLGLGFLEMVNEKVAVLGPQGDELEIFGSWAVIKNKNDKNEEVEVLVSNRTWENRVVHTDHRRASIAALAQQAVVPGVSAERPGGADGNASTFREAKGSSRSSIAYETGQQKQVQEDASRAGAERKGWTDKLICAGQGCSRLANHMANIGSKFYCWQCWSEEQKRAPKLYGTCDTCKVNFAGAQRKSNQQWICHACWLTNSKPEIFFVEGRRESYD